MVLLMGLVPGVDAQFDDMNVTALSGIAVPLGVFADYMDVGPSFGLQVSGPALGPVDLLLSGGADMLNGNSRYGLPDMRLWRYQAGVGAELLGRDTERWGLRAGLGLGATTFRSNGFLRVGSPEEQVFEKTYLTGSGGVELVVEADENLEGYFGARAHWTPMDEDDTQVLRNRAPNSLGAISSSLSVPLTLGLRIHL
jgi:hypothetical protein